MRVRVGKEAVRVHAVLSRPGELDHDQRLLVEGGRDSGALLEVGMRKPDTADAVTEFTTLFEVQKRKDTPGCACVSHLTRSTGEVARPGKIPMQWRLKLSSFSAQTCANKTALEICADSESASAKGVSKREGRDGAPRRRGRGAPPSHRK